MTNDQTWRTAIVVAKTLDPGAVANASAIVMGQLAIEVGGLYQRDGVLGADGTRHAGIRNNVVVLKGRQGQVDSVLDEAAATDGVDHVAFTEVGRNLSNSFEEYEAAVRERPRQELVVVALGIAGPEERVRQLTKKLSYYGG